MLTLLSAQGTTMTGDCRRTQTKQNHTEPYRGGMKWDVK